MIRKIGKLLGGGFLNRILDTVDKKIASETDREKIKSEIIMEHMRTRSEWMRAGGFCLMLMFSVPAAFWFTAVILSSVFWCPGCAFPQEWHIAALPPPLDEWLGLIITSIFGVVGVTRAFGKR